MVLVILIFNLGTMSESKSGSKSKITNHRIRTRKTKYTDFTEEDIEKIYQNEVDFLHEYKNDCFECVGKTE